MKFIQAVWETTQALALPLFFGLAVAGLLHVFVKKERILKHLGKPGLMSSMKASLVGVPLPLCSCSVLPTALGLRKDGASRGAVTSFLISTPQTGVDSVFVAWGILGWPVALAKVVTAFLAGVVGGTVADAVDRGEELEESTAHGCTGSERGSVVARVWDYAVGTIFRDIYLWLGAGIIISALIVTFLEPGQLAEYPILQGPLGLLAALAVGIPLYVCSTASVPIAAGLIYAGFPVGSALVFLMAGPATNAVTIGAVRKALGGKVFLIYLATVVVFSLGAGLLLNSLEVSTTGGLHEHMGGSLQRISGAVAGILMVLGMLWFAISDLKERCSNRADQDEGDGSLLLSVDGMTCHGCENTVKRVLEGIHGVQKVIVSASSGTAHITGDGQVTLDRSAAESLVRKAGFEIRDSEGGS